MFYEWEYNKGELEKNQEYYGRVLAINEKENKLLFLHGDEEIQNDKIYSLDFKPEDLEWYQLNMKAQKFFYDFETRGLAINDIGNKPLKYVTGPRIEIITPFDGPIFLKTPAI